MPTTPAAKSKTTKPVAPRKPAARKPTARKPTAASAAKFSATAALSIGAIAVAAGAGLLAFLTRGRIAALLDGAQDEGADAAGHVPTDLLDPNRNADDRAIADFRPDINAPMSASEREALRPATGPAPTLVADHGTMNSQTAPAN